MSTSVTVSGNEPTSITITQSNAAAATANNLSSVLSNTSSDISSLKGATGTLDTNINTVSGLITSNDSEISALNTATGDLSTATGVLQSATGSFAQTDQPASFSTLDVSGQSQFDKKVKITPNNGIALHAHSSGTNNAAVRIECEGPVLVGHDLFQKGGFTDGFADGSNHFHALIDINRIEQQPAGDVKNIERVEEKYYAIQNNNLPNSKAAFWEWHKVARTLAVSTVDTSTATLDVSLLQNSSNRSGDSQAFFSLNTTPDGKSEEITITLSGHMLYSNGDIVRMTFNQSFEGPIVAASLFGKVTSVTFDTFNVELYGGNYKTTSEVPLGTSQTGLAFDNVILESIGGSTRVQNGNETNLQLYSKTNFTPNRLKDETLKATWSVAHGLVKNEHCTLITDGRGDFDIIQSAYVLDPDPDGDNLSVILVYGQKVKQFDLSSFTAFGSENWTLHKGSIDGIHNETIGDNLFSFNANNVGEYNSYQIGPGSQVDADCISIGKNVYNKDASTIKIGYDNEMLNITSTGVEVSGGLTIAEKIIHKDDPNTFLRFGTNPDTFAITTSGAERLHIGPLGNVGIGVNPLEKLHVEEGIILANGSSTSHGFELRRDTFDTFQIKHLDGNFTINNSTDDRKDLSIDGNGNVGIGTSSPDTQLHIKSTGAVAVKLEADTDNVTETDNPLIQLIQDSGQMHANIGLNGAAGTAFTDALENAFYIEHNRSIQFANDNQAHLTIATSGKVGIGTHYPSSLLTLSGSGGDTSGLMFQNSTEKVRQYFDTDSEDSDFFITYEGNGGAEITLQHDGKLALNASNGDNVGIGTDSPQAKLHVSGDAIVSGSLVVTDQIEIGTGTAIGPLHVFNPGNSNTTLAKFENSDTTSNDHDANVEIISKGQGESTIQFKNPDITHTDGFQIGFGHAQSENLFFRNAHDSRTDMVITQSGNVGIGTTTPGEALEVEGNIKASGTITSTSTVSRPIQNNEDDDATNTDSKPIRNIRNMKQSAYDDLVTAGNVDDHTLYIIVG